LDFTVIILLPSFYLRFLQSFRTPENQIRSGSLLFSEQSFCRSLNCSVMARPVVGK
jgi:hypothetical protein